MKSILEWLLVIMIIVFKKINKYNYFGSFLFFRFYFGWGCAGVVRVGIESEVVVVCRGFLLFWFEGLVFLYFVFFLFGVW